MNNTINPDGQVLVKAFHAWSAAGTLRSARARCKRFVYGDQWADPCADRDGRRMTEAERVIQNGATPLTNNLLRQLLRTVVGRFRSEVIDKTEHSNRAVAELHRAASIDELDSRLLEEFLISGCAIQRVERRGDGSIEVANVNVNHWMADRLTDPRASDCTLVGQLHELTMADLLRRVAAGRRGKAQWVRRLYTSRPDERTSAWTTAIGADTARCTDFWHSASERLRAIEVWTRESEEVAVCHNRRTATLSVIPLTEADRLRRLRQDPDVQTRWDIVGHWQCRWFSPMGDLLTSYRADHHPFAMKLYPLVDGEVHSFVEGAIDQQKHVNRMITLLDQVMAANAKGVLLFPETALPDGFTWADIRRAWSNPGGIIPYDPRQSDARPEQIVSNGTDIGAYEMVKLQMQLLEQVSGVSGALQGRTTGEHSVSLYQMQTRNAEVALTDLYDSFQNFRNNRDKLIEQLTRHTP